MLASIQSVTGECRIPEQGSDVLKYVLNANKLKQLAVALEECMITPDHTYTDCTFNWDTEMTQRLDQLHRNWMDCDWVSGGKELQLKVTNLVRQVLPQSVRVLRASSKSVPAHLVYVSDAEVMPHLYF